MANVTKRRQAINEALVKAAFPMQFNDAITLLKTVSKVKFNETVELCVNLGIDARKSDQVVRGATLLPHGTGKSVRVAVFAQGAQADAAKAAGADVVGFEDLAAEIKAGNLDFGVVIASPDSMRIVGQLGQILGPRGLMPNPKLGTVSPDVAGAVKNAKSGQARYRTDKNGIIHCAVGTITFDATQLKENIKAVIADLIKAKPSTAKGIYLKKISISSTMGPGLLLEQSSILV